MKVPNIENAILSEQKILSYLLDETNEGGRSKAEFFLRHGFLRESWQEFAEALRKHGAHYEVAFMRSAGDGIRYAVEGELILPDGKQCYLRTVWMIDAGEDIPRLITAFPIIRKG
jgi:hypothetical protein